MVRAPSTASMLLTALVVRIGAPTQDAPIPAADETAPAVTREEQKDEASASDADVVDDTVTTAEPGATDYAETAEATPADQGWPRSFEVRHHEVTLYQPQLLDWTDYTTLTFDAAVAVRAQAEEEPVYGVINGTATTRINHEDRTVLLDDPKYTTTFPDLPGSDIDTLTAVVTETLGEKTRSEVVIDLDRLIANVERGAIMQREIDVGYDPPPIFVSRHNAILVIYMGEPQFEPIEGTSLSYAVNTNWDVLRDSSDDRVYMLLGDGWVSADDPVNGVWATVAELPPAFAELPDDPNWSEVKAHVPGLPLRAAPKIHVTTEPAELIVLDGPPTLDLIPGTELMYASNTASDLFLNLPDRQYYCLIAGRWFRAPSLDGPWSTASADLPAVFTSIPPEHPKAHVLASIPGTPEADDALIQASIPHKATVSRVDVSIEVDFDGEPDFTAITGSDGVRMAINSTDAVFQVGTRYYCCRDGIWFEAEDPGGPWEVSAAVPKEIYTIPADSPAHNVTYVHVYDATPTEVTTGYTSGYSGSYVVGGVLLFGAAVAALALSDANVRIRVRTGYLPPSWYSYGCQAQYRHYRGGWVRAAHHYGPYGGVGYGARFNARTGTYSRGAFAYGPRQAAAAGSAFNPWTGRGAATAQSRTPYGSWGRSVAYDGNDWARFGHRSGPYGTTVAYRTSDGNAGIGRIGRPRSSPRVYAGPDGNVYRVGSNDQWQRRGRGGWESTKMRHDVGDARRQDARMREAGAQRPAAAIGDRSAPKPTSRDARRYLDASPGSPDVQRYLNAQSRSRQRGIDHTRRRSSLDRRGGRSGGRASGGRRR